MVGEEPGRIGPVARGEPVSDGLDDLTVITEAPKLGPHVGGMGAALAARLGLAPGAVNVKAKTNEGMGFIGRGEGLAVIAVATLEAR